MELKIDINDLARAKLAKLESTPQRMLRPLARAWGEATQIVLGRAVRNRFTGKGPYPASQNKLGVRTGLLRRSVRAAAPQLNPDSGEITVGMGSNVPYFETHEFGFKGQVQVKGHTRKTVGGVKSNSRGRLTKASVARLKGRAQSGRKSYSYVRPHSRKLNTPARRPLGTELESIQTRLILRTKTKAAMAAILSLK